jgi:hypothetical protein
MSSQSLAEAVARRFSEPLIRPPSDELRVEYSATLVKDEWYGPISKLQGVVGNDGVERIATKDILDLVRASVRDTSSTARIGKLMDHFGWRPIQLGADGKSKGNAIRGYSRKPMHRPKPVEVLPDVGGAADGVVVLRGTTIRLVDGAGKEFVTDLARNIERVLPDLDFATKHGLTDEGWEQLGRSAALHHAVREALDHRIHSGVGPRERAQVYFAQAPKVLNDIMTDKNNAPQHRIEASKNLQKVAGNETTFAEERDRVRLTINLGFGQPLKIEAVAPKPESEDTPLIEHDGKLDEPPPADQ